MKDGTSEHQKEKLEMDPDIPCVKIQEFFKMLLNLKGHLWKLLGNQFINLKTGKGKESSIYSTFSV